MKCDDFNEIMREQDRLEREYRAAVHLLVTVGPRATELEYLMLKTSVEDVRYDLENLRLKLETQRSVRTQGAVAQGV